MDWNALVKQGDVACCAGEYAIGVVHYTNAIALIFKSLEQKNKSWLSSLDLVRTVVPDQKIAEQIMRFVDPFYKHILHESYYHNVRRKRMMALLAMKNFTYAWYDAMELTHARIPNKDKKHKDMECMAYTYEHLKWGAKAAATFRDLYLETKDQKWMPFIARNVAQEEKDHLERTVENKAIRIGPIAKRSKEELKHTKMGLDAFGIEFPVQVPAFLLYPQPPPMMHSDRWLELLNKPLFLSDVLGRAESKIHGRGLIARQKIPAGTIFHQEEAAVFSPLQLNNHCSCCNAPLRAKRVTCPTCVMEHYCSKACRKVSWEKEHKYICSEKHMQDREFLFRLASSQHKGSAAYRTSRLSSSTLMVKLVGHTLATGHSATPGTGTGKMAQPVAATTTKSTMELPFLETHHLAYLHQSVSTEQNALNWNLRLESVAYDFLVTCTGVVSHPLFSFAWYTELFHILQRCKHDVLGTGSAFFPNVSFVNHSCDPNAVYLIGPREKGHHPAIQLKSKRDIEVGEEITISYTGSPLVLSDNPTPSEKDDKALQLLSHELIKCKCERCRQESEKS